MLEMLVMESCIYTFNSSRKPQQHRFHSFSTPDAHRNGLILASSPMFELLYSIQSDSHTAGNVPRRSESHKPAGLVKACWRNWFGFSREKVFFC